MSNNLACYYIHIVQIWYMISLLAFATKTTTNLTYSPISPEGELAYFTIVALRPHTHTFNIMCICIIYTHWHVFFWHIPKGYMFTHKTLRWNDHQYRSRNGQCTSFFLFGKVEMVRFIDPSDCWMRFFWVSGCVCVCGLYLDFLLRWMYLRDHTWVACVFLSLIDQI